MSEKYQKIVVTGFLYDQGKVLVVKRAESETFLPGYFEMPGGKVDFGEDPQLALEREYEEEVGLKINVGKPFRTFAYTSSGGERHTVEIVYLASLEIENRDVMLGKDHTEFSWIGMEDVEKYKFSDEMRKSVLEGFQRVSLQ